MKKVQKKLKKNALPESFRPILWSFDWDRLGIQKDKEDIIVNTINEGSVDQWRWIRKSYGDSGVRGVLRRRLASEFHPESLSLAKVIFGAKSLPHARRRSHAEGA